MDKKHFITVSLLLSALAFNPLVANELYLSQISSQRQANTISSEIASLLYSRGLDEEVALELSEELVEDNEFFEAMLSNLLNHYPDITTEALFAYLSTVALHKQSIDLSSYDHLVNMVSKIKGTILTENELKSLSHISKVNKLLA